MSAALVSVIGPPAAGKTTLAEWLGGALPAQVIREDYAGNPFLEDAWLGRRELALPAQLYFLFSRIGQLSLASWPGDGIVVSDYGFCQDALYAERGLGPEDLAVYRRLAACSERLVKPPDVLVHLDCAESALLERIARRGRRHETAFSAAFLRAMRQAYRKLVGRVACPVVTVDSGAVNLLSALPRQEVLESLRRALGKGAPSRGASRRTT